MKRTILFLIAAFSISCKKEGPQGPPGPAGPPGEDLTRPKEGYIRGYVSGKNENGTPFRIDFNYQYYFFPAAAESLSANQIRFSLERLDSAGAGSVYLRFTWDRSTNAISDSSINGGIARQQSNGKWLVYEIPFLNPIPFTSLTGTPLQITNVQYQNGMLSGKFTHIHPTYDVNFPTFQQKNTYADTLRGEFSVRVTEFQRVSRQAPTDRDPRVQKGMAID